MLMSSNDQTGDFEESDDQGSEDPSQGTLAHPSAGASHSATPPQQIGDYIVLGVLGEGGMGVVYKARHLGLKRLVALKMIRAGGASERDRLRFQAEVEAVARLQHPGIVGIYEVGEFAGQPFCALEYVEGGSLEKKLAGQALPPRKAARLAENLARAAHAIHELQLVHRDLKPSNVLLQGRPDEPVEHCTLKISDFGLAKMLDGDGDTGLTREGAVMGTPFYMAPEQAAGRTADIDRRADVYSLGAILYEMLTGRPPLKGNGVSETLWLVLNEEPLSPARVVRGVDRDLETICLKCLEKEPDLRFASALDLADELERYLNEEPILTRRAGLLERVFKWARRRPAVAAAWALTLLVTLIGSAGGFAGWQWLQAEAAREQADVSRQQAEQARQQAEGANARLEEQKRLAEEARTWALKDRLKADQDQAKDREPAARIEARLRSEFEQTRKRLNRTFYFRQIDLAHRRWQSDQTAQAQQVLASCSLEGRSWEHGHVDRLCRGAMLQVPPQAQGPFTHLEFSVEGIRLATAGNFGVHVWDFPARTNVLTILVRARWVRFSHDGKWLVIPHERGVKLYDAKTGAPGREMAGLAKHQIDRAALRPDGSHLAIVDPGNEEVPVFDFATGRRLFSLPGHPGGALTVAYSPDGKRLATATNDGFRLWEATTGKLLHTIPTGIDGHSHPLAFSRDSRRIACIDGSRVGVWDVASGDAIARIEGGQRVVRCAALTLDGQPISGGSDTTVRTWDLQGQPHRAFRGLPTQVEAMIVNPKSGSVVAWDRDGNAALWDPTVDQEARILPHQSAVVAVAFHPESKSVASMTPQGVRLFDPESGKEVGAHAAALGNDLCTSFGSGGRLLACGGENGIVVLDRINNRVARQEKTKASALAMSPKEDRLVVAGARLTVHDGATGKELFACAEYTGKANAVAFAPDGKQFAIAEERGVAVFASGTGKRLGGYPVFDARALAYSPDGKLLAAVLDNKVLLWSAETGKVSQELTHVSLVNAVAFSADGLRIATGGYDRALQVWDVATGQPTLTLTGHTSIILGLAFSADGRWLASASADQTARLWDAGPRETK